jgi:hydrogenase maturation protein HypF
MQTYHIHIKGRVQGVGFRPYAAALAEARKLRGTVSNGMDGVHICLQTCETFAREFLDYLLAHPPANSIITGYTMELSGMGDEQTPVQDPFPIRPYGLQILESSQDQAADLLLTPDIALCPDCRAELTLPGNRRNGYAFTTCLHCGPRYSIVTKLPYDRPHTTMASLSVCPSCQAEYTDIRNRRHFSQTNSCPECAIPMHWYIASGEESPLTRNQDGRMPVAGTVIPQKAANSGQGQAQLPVIREIAAMIDEGKIIAVKGIGGYLILCDASREDAVMKLRRRKHRPSKPFAVLYPDLESAKRDLEIRPFEAEALQSTVAPIVLCKRVHGSSFMVHGIADIQNLHSEIFAPTSDIRNPTSEISTHTSNFKNLKSNFLSPGLHRIGLMLPYTPLLQLIATACNKPLVATSGNLSGSPIIYQDEVALENLWSVTDAILAYDREIVTPQDDSVWQFTDSGERIILRRSRGMAPDYYPHGLGETTDTLLAMGADLKSSFAIHHRYKVYVSQYLGDLEDYRSQEAWQQSQQQLCSLVQASPDVILADLHPGYHSRLEGLRIADTLDIPLVSIQHHEAHFAAVLAENKLLESREPILGLIWDGTGYGTDGQSWGGEVFIYSNGEIDRALHLDYFPQLLGDKMSLEPRLSALSLLHGHVNLKHILHAYFSDAEWDYYSKVLRQENSGLSSSMGRLIDGVASIIGVCQFNSYEAQAAMELEALAASAEADITTPYPFTIRLDRIDWRPMIEVLLADKYRGVSKETMALRFFTSLAQLLVDIAYRFDIPKLAVSGGVFQNALLLDLIRQRLPKDLQLYTHQQLSPNDECIGLGQLAWYHMKSYALPPTP